jgi:hypothetical protein
MPGVSIEDEVRAAIREVLLPELHILHEDLQALRAEMVLLRGATGPLRGILLAGLQRLDVRLEAIERGVRRPTPCARAATRCRPGRRR